MINLFQPCLGEEELGAVGEVFRSNWIGKGKKVAEFEKRFAETKRVQESHMVSTTCCTEGLFAAPKLFNLEGSDVVVPTISFGAVGNAVKDAGARVVLCDVNPHSLNVEAKHIREAMTEWTTAVFITHYGGVPCEMEDIRALCNKYGLVLIEDAACTPHSFYAGEACGTIGDMGVWSFDPMKILVTGDGGMVYLKDESKVDQLKEHLYLGLPGRSKSGIDSVGKDAWWEFDVKSPGRRAIMNDISGAIGVVQLEKLGQFIQRRKEIDGMYRDGLKNTDWVTICPKVPDHCTSSYYMFWIQCEHRTKLARHLLNRGVYTTFRYWPLHKTSLFSSSEKFINADFAANYTLNIPIHQSLTNQEVDYVIDSIRSFPG